MTVELTTEEKINIVKQHLKTVAYSEYNTMLSLAEAQAVATPNAATIASLNNQIQDSLAQKQALQDEIDSLES
jgi:transcriptional regulator NrdR family protein